MRRRGEDVTLRGWGGEEEEQVVVVVGGKSLDVELVCCFQTQLYQRLYSTMYTSGGGGGGGAGARC